eukprot:CAMPEP_0113607142 /NCGR_PEP_ID=MMETSP0017_2-20120614/3226_1 /TAXON_ID=2856 /ORGANISM="Cylindrotheca closterium" /LENGTH=517 /DNA_ID=CAMNT_0000515725 /DNA_START=14 /DNA_END=1565 /DNA_ORIENTATION=- /assembly_acc=CAM_ASM_000147
MNFVPSWRNPMKRRRRRRRLKTKVYAIILVGTFLIVLHIYQTWQWNEFRKTYWAEELILYDGGGMNSNDKNSGNLRGGGGTNGNSYANTTHAADDTTTTNPHAKWNPQIVFTHRDVQLAEKPAANKAAFLRDSRHSMQFSDFVKPNTEEDLSDGHAAESMTYEQAKEGREPLLEILEQDLGLAKLTTSELMQLPKWSEIQDLYGEKEIQDLYGEKPILVGMDMCLKYQAKVPPPNRYIGVAGSFNTGTTAFGLSLQQNCRFPNRKATAKTNGDQATNDKNLVTNVHGMLNQVPWAKHKMAFERFGHTIDEGIPKEDVLPVVLVRDPYYWMQSMCKQGYGVRWDHNAKKHCPNLVPNDYDKKRFVKRYASNASSVPVWMGKSYNSGPHWDSLVHYWNDWYGSYYYYNGKNAKATTTTAENRKEDDFPRLIIRFEDTLFHAKTVMKMVCACGGGIFSGNEDEEEEEESNNGGSAFRPILDEAKFEHKHVQNNLVSAIVKYGTDRTRYRNMTREDLEFAQ